MQKDIQNLLASNSELVIDSLLENGILKEIPILNTSLNLIRGIRSIRETAYINKIKHFIENLGELTETKRLKLIEESRKDSNKRSKFGDALFTTIEQSDSLLKIEYLAVIFEAFLNGDFSQKTLRLLCHIIQVSFSDDLELVIESDINYKDINLEHLVATGLAKTVHSRIQMGGSTAPNYDLTKEAELLKKSWEKYKIISN